MSRLLCQFVSSLTLVGYLVVVTWGPAWHDHHHHHGHCPSHDGANTVFAPEHAGHSHGPCCGHHHSSCSEEETSNEPCPLHDDDCVICQVLAHPPLTPPAIELVDVGEAVPAWVELFVPSPAFSLSPVYDSRGPPLV